MKVICENETKNANGVVVGSASKFLLPDDATVEMESDKIVVGPHGNYPSGFIIQCQNSSDSTLYENVTDAPSDWIGNKYFYDGTWAENSEFIAWEPDDEDKFYMGLIKELPE